ncbi:MAG: heavy metal translocating P-type ATPase [Anaerolineae bacterium]|nr:heavy metal translocating P-type ATPase [Thermoflexales bacterium]MDW8407374.1 heavy metal translocating P-type ATPase [Anaerolineae bacterium]
MDTQGFICPDERPVDRASSQPNTDTSTQPGIQSNTHFLCAQCGAMISGYVQQERMVCQAVGAAGAPCDILLNQGNAASAPASTLNQADQTHWIVRARNWFTEQRVEALCVPITLIAMLLGLGAERLMNAPVPSAVFYTLAYITGGAFGLKGGIEALRERTIDVDLLMVLAAIGAAIVGAPFEGAMLLFLFSLSNVLQAFAIGRTRDAIRSLAKLRPTRALVRRGSRLELTPIERILVGDRIVVRPGERIALDGVVVEGESTVDQASITGESMPVFKKAGDRVFAGTINQRGSLEVRVTRLATDSTIARLIKLVEEAQSEKARTQRFLDKAERYYAAGVLAFTALMIIVPPLIFNEQFETAFYRAMTLMVVASPCALVISTPATILSAIGNGARRGILFKGGVHLEQAAGIRTVAFDKTGTLTEGKPRVTDIIVTPAGEIADWSGSEAELLALAAAVEAKSEHPVAHAIVGEAKARGLGTGLSPATDFTARPGLGVRAVVNGQIIAIGSPRYFESVECMTCSSAAHEVTRLQGEGKTAMLVARLLPDQRSAEVLGVIAVADRLRAGAAQVVRELREMGLRTVMLTGDNSVVAQAIAAQAGVDAYYAELLPEDKVRLIKEMTHQGPVAMVGDGINDAPALATATVGIAMGAAGADVALETADIVLMSDDLSNIPYVIALSRRAQRTVIQNLAFAGAVILIMLAAAMGVQVPLPLGVVAHEGSTVLVSLNGLRLLAFRRARRMSQA